MKTGTLEGCYILMVVAPAGFCDEEFFESKRVFEALGAVVEVASTVDGAAHSELGTRIYPDLRIDAAALHVYNAVVLVGGPGAQACLWEDELLHAVLRLALAHGTPIGAISLAAVVLARAGLLRDVRATVFDLPRAKYELVRGRAFYVDQDVVVDRGIITGAGPHAARAFAEAVARAVMAREFRETRV